MDTKLEKMRGEIRRRVGFAGGLAICLALLLIAVAAGAVPVRLDNPAVSEFISGFRFGVLMALCLYFLWRTAVYLRALRGDGALRRVYNREHDERAGYIQQQVGRSSLDTELSLEDGIRMKVHAGPGLINGGKQDPEVKFILDGDFSRTGNLTADKVPGTLEELHHYAVRFFQGAILPELHEAMGPAPLAE